MHSESAGDPLPQRGTPSAPALLEACKAALESIRAVEHKLGPGAGPGESVWTEMENLWKSVYRIPFHPIDYIPAGSAGLKSDSALEDIRRTFERAGELRSEYLLKVLVELDSDLPDRIPLSGRTDALQKLERMRTYIQKQVDHFSP